VNLAACGGGVPLETVPADPIAFVRQEASKGLLSLDTFREGLQVTLESRRERKEREREGRRPSRSRTSLMLLTVPTGEMSPIADAGEGSLPLDWSSDGSRLLFGRVNPSGRGPVQLFTWNRLTNTYRKMKPGYSSGAAALGDGPIQMASVRQLLAPDGDTVLGIVIHSVGEGMKPLATGIGGIDPDVAPDGTTVVFVRPAERPGREPHIIISRLHGEGEGRAIARGRRPRFSRDGRWVVFERDTAGNADVWLMRADGSGKRRVVGSSFDDEDPAVSPLGDYVVYSSVRGSEQESQLFITRVADGAEAQLTQNGQNGRPIW
jgi:Tol biopolymer transport system component